MILIPDYQNIDFRHFERGGNSSRSSFQSRPGVNNLKPILP